MVLQFQRASVFTSLEQAEGSELVAVMRRTPGAAEKWAHDNVPGGKCKGYDDLESFLADPNIDAVCV